MCLVDFMLYTGKIYYAIQQLLGYSNWGEAIGYSSDEHHWCKEHESDILNYMKAQGNLYARDPMIIKKYLKLSPDIDVDGAEVPPLIGAWLGAKIVSLYMEKHKEVSLQQLLEDADYRRLLSESEYNL